MSIAATVLGAWLAVALGTAAWPGSGHSEYGGDFSGLVGLVLWAVLRHPLLAIPLVALGLWVAYKTGQSSESGNWDVRGARYGRTAQATVAMSPPPPRTPAPFRRPAAVGEPPPHESAESPPPAVPPVASGIVEGLPLRVEDPEFSIVLFEDLASRLYAAAHSARHDDAALRRLAPYLAPAVRAHLAHRDPLGGRVSDVVVGGLEIGGVSATPGAGDRRPQVRLSVAYEAKLRLEGAERSAQYVSETWHFTRLAGTRTRPWKMPRTFGCPNCGARLASSGGPCTACGESVGGGTFDWSVERIELRSVEEAAPSIGGDVNGGQSDRPTVVDPDMEGAWAALTENDPAVTDTSLGARLHVIFRELQASWSACDLSRVRPFVTDGVFGYLQYWLGAYRDQGLRNVIEGATLERWERVRVARDSQFEAVTFRVFGRGRDYTVEAATGRIVGGDADGERRYAEHWTLVRSASARGEPKVDKVCPCCSAPLKIGRAGNCARCGNRVTTGECDWVLSKVEPDRVVHPVARMPGHART